MKGTETVVSRLTSLHVFCFVFCPNLHFVPFHCVPSHHITTGTACRAPPPVFQYLSCSSMCRAKLIGYTGCPDPSLSGVISLYFVAVVLWPSSFSPSVALTRGTLPPICSKLTTASITLVTIFGIVEVPAVLHCRECPPGLVWASLWYVMNLPHG